MNSNSSSADEMRIEMGEGNEALEAMDLHSTLPESTIGGVIALGLTIESQPIKMTMAWASQDQSMIERGDEFYYDREGIRHRRVEREG